ncbi:MULTISPECIES: hypothetical protein [unclassified Granulicatella]|uniref:hypothetical protein n=1 Tax=unclassified Granulicatella TaxID=2630493 RepID=UPI00107369FE|nr:MULTISPECIES: hypothetical protein [unclassified Granulicatella]MBF0779740.1 hypothetical protein [Granulicatella sp. 19428wC4_WM01]TFU96259.1 hypothetical protein E4T68_01410 [Granulicatella sp. WM01]
MAIAYYDDYVIKPYISPKRDLTTEEFKPVPRRNMELLSDSLLAGDIILLWRIHFGTFTNETVFPKYFEYTYGIHAAKHLEMLLEKGYAVKEAAFDSLDHLNATQKKKILKAKHVSGLSKLKSVELDEVLRNHFTEEELGTYFSVRGILLSEKGKLALEKHHDVVDRHPKKNI